MTPGLDPARYPSLIYEQSLWDAGYTQIAGIDEAGRGAWAGPVCAAALILPPDPSILHTLDRVRDSKLMTPLARETWAPRIRLAAVAWGVGFASSQEIDTLGILPATKLAATRALASLSSSPDLPSPAPSLFSSHPAFPGYPIPGPLSSAPFSPSPLSPDFLLTDYLIFPELEWDQIALIKGDRLSLSVAGASVLAKTARDALMRFADSQYPGYGFARHKGYGTRLHQQSLHQLGLSEIHRKSFSIRL
ncbi:MAG: ribonuclease HII [Anaerolineales bacterium]|jgi:ribonuclease HII